MSKGMKEPYVLVENSAAYVMLLNVTIVEDVSRIAWTVISVVANV